VALKRRDTAELIAEELRRLDPDDTYASALRFGVDRLNPSAPFPERGADAKGPDAKGSDAEGPDAKGEPVSGGPASADPVAGSTELAVEAPGEGAAEAPGSQGQEESASASLKPVPSGLSGKAAK
jgi:hypothetical protein